MMTLLFFFFFFGILPSHLGTLYGTAFHAGDSASHVSSFDLLVTWVVALIAPLSVHFASRVVG